MISYVILMAMLLFAVLGSLMILGALSKLPEKERESIVEITVGTRIIGLLSVALTSFLCFNICSQFQDTISLVFSSLYIAYSVINLRRSTFAAGKGTALDEDTIFWVIAINTVFLVFLGVVGICQLF